MEISIFYLWGYHPHQFDLRILVSLAPSVNKNEKSKCATMDISSTSFPSMVL